MNRFFLFIAFILFFLPNGAQEKLSLQQAVTIALQNNYSIRIAKNDSLIAVNNATLGNAGFFPLVYLGAGYNFADNETHQQYSSGLEVDKTGVKSSGLNLGIGMNWTIFDGMKMFATYDKLKELRSIGELGAKISIENTIALVTISYFDVVQQKQLLLALEDAIGVYDERVKIAETKYSLGNGNKRDVLQAKVDRNEIKSSMLKQKVVLANSKVKLNEVLSRSSNLQFDVTDSISISVIPGIEELRSSITKNNRSVLQSRMNVNLAQLEMKEINAMRWPQVGLNASYNFTRSENQAGFMLLNQNLGLNFGVTATWTLFNGFNAQRQSRNANIMLQTSKLEEEMVILGTNSRLISFYNDYTNALEILKLEEENYLLAKENLSIAMETYKLGSLTSVELKESQNSFLNAETRLITARYGAKFAETELLRLNGMLVK
jgi:outer membrane protein